MRTKSGWTQERREKMRLMMTGSGNPRFGVIESEEIRKKKSIAHTGIKRKPMSDETKQKISLAKKGKKMSLESRRKMSESRRGEKAYNWRGGICKLRHLIHTCLEKRIWREAVFSRDLYTCIKCGQIGGSLQADHIKPMSIIMYENNINSLEEALLCPDLWSVNNGQTLCLSCHKEKTKIDLLNIREIIKN